MKVAAYLSPVSLFNSVRMGHSNEQHHEHPSNKETLEWYKNRLQNGKVSEETYKREAVAFFNLSPEDSFKSKQIFKKEIENFVAMHKNMKKTLLRKFWRKMRVQELITRFLQKTSGGCR